METKNGLLYTEDYLLIVPSEFDVRWGDWDILDSSVKISEENVKISITSPSIFSEEEKNYTLGIYQNRVLCLIKYDFLGDKLWDQCFPSSGRFGFTSAIEKPNGGYLLGGSSNHSSLENKTDMWIISTDKAGQVGWDINLGGHGTQIFYSMINSINGIDRI